MEIRVNCRYTDAAWMLFNALCSIHIHNIYFCFSIVRALLCLMGGSRTFFIMGREGDRCQGKRQSHDFQSRDGVKSGDGFCSIVPVYDSAATHEILTLKWMNFCAIWVGWWHRNSANGRGGGGRGIRRRIRHRSICPSFPIFDPLIYICTLRDRKMLG